MSLLLPKYCLLLLYSLSLHHLTSYTLAKTNTFVENSSENKIQFDCSEFFEDVTLSNVSSARPRTLNCVPIIKHFEVELTGPLKRGEGVGLTGDHPSLGRWQIDKSLEMIRRNSNSLRWFLKIPMCSALRVYYRFFIYYKDSKGSRRVRYWESQQHARVLEAYEMFRFQGSLKFGHAHDRAVGGGIENERAWLRKEYIVQLKFVWSQHIRFTEFSHFIRIPKYILKLKAYQSVKGELSFKNSKPEGDTEFHVTRFVAKKAKLKDIREQGVFYRPETIVVFHVTVADFVENLYVLGIYSRQQELLGEVLIPAELIKSSEGILELPIYDPKETRRVGWITLPFLRIEPIPEALKFNLRSGFHHYWPFNWPTLDIGQRGLGKSFYYNSANVLENTIESFLKAKEENADMVQLDVQLTKDYVPVVWHDFGFYTTGPRNDLTYVHLHDLTYKELLKKKVFMFIKGHMVEMTYLNTPFVADTKRIFPQLSQVYQKLPSTFGIVVNIKWPQLLSSGVFESLGYLDKNRYVNKVVQVTTEYGCGRPLIMASFDADICTMLRFKQHMYPTIFLTIGRFSPWESYADLRTHSLANAIQFAQASDILGTAVYAKELYPHHDNKDLDMAFELQQRVFVWGNQLNNVSVLNYFRNQEVAGLIYDHIDTLMQQKPKTKRKRFSIFGAQQLQRIFRRQCIAAGNTTMGEGLPDTHSPFFPRFRSLN